VKTELEIILRRRGLLEQAQRILDRYAPATFAHVVGRARWGSISQARHEIIALLVEHAPDLSAPEIGRLIGGRDHTSILNSCHVMGIKKIAPKRAPPQPIEVRYRVG
jgi:chromosomal replication initiation ATPase DnaA